VGKKKCLIISKTFALSELQWKPEKCVFAAKLQRNLRKRNLRKLRNPT
jgi:hypothetical protein